MSKIYDKSYYDYWDIESDYESLRMMKLRSSFAYLDILKKYFPPELDKPKLLDIGCSYGFMLQAASFYKMSASGIEISPAAKIARESGFVVYGKPLEKMELPGKYFDIITIIDVLEHIHSISHFFDKLVDILKDTGILFLLTPNIHSLGAKLLREKWPHYKAEHIGYFNKHSIIRLLEANGLIIKEMRTGFKYLSIGYIFRHFIYYSRREESLLAAKIYKLIPKFIKSMIIKVPTGMIAVSKKSS